MKFASKKDGWAHLTVAVLLFGCVSFFCLASTGQGDGYLVLGILTAAALVTVFPVYALLFFELQDNDLMIWCGPYRKRIPYTVITRAVKTTEPGLSLSCSLDRLDFRFREKGKHKKLLIAPVDRDLFQRMLLLKNPMIQIDDNGPRAYDSNEFLTDRLSQKGAVPNGLQDKGDNR